MDIEKILQQMTLEDKIALCSGENFWETKKYEKYGIPSLFMCDGPHGLRKQENAADMLGVNESRKATCFPAEATAAGSWNPELLAEIGAAIGEEAREQGIHGKETTPFLLARVVELTGGDSLESNIQLVLNNAIVASKTAAELCK